eukprot:scaffold16294_cov17-Tisochrysis_lutea.AAC.2
MPVLSEDRADSPCKRQEGINDALTCAPAAQSVAAAELQARHPPICLHNAPRRVFYVHAHCSLAHVHGSSAVYLQARNASTRALYLSDALQSLLSGLWPQAKVRTNQRENDKGTRIGHTPPHTFWGSWGAVKGVLGVWMSQAGAGSPREER